MIDEGYEKGKIIQESREAEIEKVLHDRYENEKKEARKTKSIKLLIAIVASLILIVCATLIINSTIIKPRQAYNHALQLMNAGRYDEATSEFLAMEKYSDAPQQAIESQYQKATSFISAKEYEKAYHTFKTIISYKDVDSILKTDPNMLNVHQSILKSYSVNGTIVTLGSFDQDGDSTNGREPIEWIAVGVTENNKALLLSLYAFEAMGLSYSDENVKWSESRVKNWLTGTFYRRAFTDGERRGISESDITILSKDQCSSYLTTNQKICKPIAVNSSWIYDDSGCSWWLYPSVSRESAKRKITGYDVYETVRYYVSPKVNGKGEIVTTKVTDGFTYVRPAIWVDLDVIDGLI